MDQLKKAFDDYEINEIFILEEELKYNTLNYADFKEKYKTDEWNEQIYRYYLLSKL